MSTQAIRGDVMETPLLIIDMLAYANQRFPDKEIISRLHDNSIHRTSYANTWARTAQLGHALEALGVQSGDFVASMAWNTHRHVELYYGIAGLGAVLHTVNPRLFSEQIEYVINHAEDTYVFVDLGFVAQLEEVAPQLTTVKGYIILCDAHEMPQTSLTNVHCYETLLAEQASNFPWPTFDEHQAAILCYTSGTTGNPKGVLYSHRSMVLHAQASASSALLDLREDTVLLPMVAMYHIGAWGAPYAAPLAGSSLVLPGHGMDGASMWQLIRDEKVNVGLGVPTIWLTLHNYLQDQGITKLPLERVCVGGAASPLGLVKTFDEDYNIYWQPIWGMTETGPLVTSLPPTKAIMALDKSTRYGKQTTAGKACFGIDMEIFDDDDQPLPHDGIASGELRVRGPWICAQYFKNNDTSNFPNGWLATGDIAVIDREGHMKVVDRTKDVIKSGGEWISSLEIESIVSQHPAVNECCVVGVKHAKWDERPLLLVVPVKGQEVTAAMMVEHLTGRIAKWWMPDDLVVVADFPRTGTGKVLKRELRNQYIDYLIKK
ncbi:long-chain fatty acid--CoA ligase [Aliidiomarina quisquiliarum]|uniref:long-chain fatty acid--CoA ligase n=1 Tax=Aliidiomarina quisquiliarum TaxID=2938947 RepID=UPI00208F5BF9|nr:long-chain fatty acid--CoA ligase [Aliidiomarina quisquiliarum]MCO4322522.1 long-chain fatty acid--CoA ligase [Aliidiomarina quisquiliarum]